MREGSGRVAFSVDGPGNASSCRPLPVAADLLGKAAQPCAARNQCARLDPTMLRK